MYTNLARVRIWGQRSQVKVTRSDGQITNQITVPNHKSFDKKILKSLCQINWEADKNNPSSGDMSIIITEEGGVQFGYSDKSAAEWKWISREDGTNH